ncbi:MAG: caspase family protein [Thermodesulfobacteriota bacterium]|nr:caspase family protein [Thermodesulfobacteriota bacterium]
MARGQGLRFVAGILLLLCSFGCAATGKETKGLAPQPSVNLPTSADELLIVDCLLPGKIHRLGGMTYLTPRRPVKTSAWKCELQGGEYVAYDRANYQTALKVWLEAAERGDPEAQTYVGDIYAKGLGVAPDYSKAAKWYQKAAEQGYKRAQTSLGYLYEAGLGVKQDLLKALEWYRKAAGDALVLGENRAMMRELQTLKQEIEHLTQESGELRKELEKSQQEVERTRRQLEKRQNDAQDELHKLKAERESLERQKNQAEAVHDYAELNRLKAVLAESDDQIKHQRGEIGRLNNEADRLRDEIQRLQDKMRRVAEAAPVIKVLEPPLIGKPEGTPTFKTRAAAERFVVGGVIAPAGLREFTVNDVSYKDRVDSDGLFRVPVSVQDTDLLVKIEAIDSKKRKATAQFRLTPEISVPVVPKDVEYGDYYALIIANQDYLNLPDLVTPFRDAEKVAEVLETKYGFRTKTIRNTNYDELFTELLNFLVTNRKETDNILIYYAGHGTIDKEVSPPRGFWLGIDALHDKMTRWLANINITDPMQKSQAKHVLIVSDSCYSAGLVTRGDVGPQTRSTDYKEVAEKHARLVLTSGGLEPVLDSIGGEHSVFARVFVEILENNDAILKGQRLHAMLYPRVKDIVENIPGIEPQNPQYLPLIRAGHNFGDFLFVPVAK